MFRSLFPFRRLLATSFLLVFVNVFVGQCYCATLTSTGTAPVAKPQVVEKPTHPGCHGHGQATAQTKPVKAQPEHGRHDSKPAGKEDCCKDNSAAILKSLTTPGEKQLLVTSPALLPASNDFFFRPAAGQWDRTNAVVLVLREHLPPKIPDIRIFIQSLTV
ncbi:hypothetical protein HNQ93_004168 [Hymenobacter luteus]|uniref:Uncharacterized protein n=2 Tax=Hymenobacter TaxID=89966 RepID=A0A7W9T5M3_9BACT|nr:MULTISPECIES: hypothetical protein [Hymenobacter]MBB4603538.1 hypothetical protein [Hymenobacter latericoloratus]MBB6061289.1 hypothetical protein [Hymenobacter luteus]UYZ61347.1 hypothetical protein OIS50_20455 [Hymenobacter sp. YIM 151858-1]